MKSEGAKDIGLFAVLVVVCLLVSWQALAAQEVPASQQPSPTLPSPPVSAKSSPPPLLQVYNFSMDDTGSSQRNALQQAVPDSLFLRIVGEPRLETRRIREPFTPGTPPSGRGISETPGSQSRLGGQSQYVLEGKLLWIEARASDTTSPASASGFLVVKYSLRKTAPNPESKPLIDRDESTTLALLPMTIQKISNEIIEALLPFKKVSVSIGPMNLGDLPESRRPFYAENLPGLLRSELLSHGWIDLVHEGDQPDFSITEAVHRQKDTKNYELEITIHKGEAEIAGPPKQIRPETEVLAAQLQLANQVVESLESAKALSLAGGGEIATPSRDDYLKAAQLHEKTDPDSAIVLYRRALELDSTNTETKLALAWLYFRKDQADEVLKLLSGPDAKERPAAQFLRSLAFARQGDKDNALAAANQCVALASQIATCHWWRGQLFVNKGDFARAVEDLEAAIELDPTDSDYYEDLARVDEKLERYDAAIAVLDDGRRKTHDAARLTATANETRRRAAAHSIEEGKPSDGLRFALAANAEEPKSEWGLRLAGVAYHELHNLPEAERCLRDALDVKETALAYGELAAIRLDKGKKDEAFTLAEKALELDRSYLWPLTIIQAGVTDAEDARKVIAWLTDYCAKNPSARDALLVWAYISEFLPGQPEEIEPLYQAYVASTKSVPYGEWTEGWANLAELDLMEGKYADAETVARELLKLEKKPEWQIAMLMYVWISQVLQGKCEAAQVSLRAFADSLLQRDLVGARLGWSFRGIHRFMQRKAIQSALDPATSELIESAFTAVESEPIESAKIESFHAKVNALPAASCQGHSSPPGS
jgi:tetratricopeptide (TPR) repeat protein